MVLKTDSKIIYSSNIKIPISKILDIDKLKSDFTKDNPKYAKIKKYSKYEFTREKPYIQYYTLTNNHVYLPIGSNIYPYLFEPRNINMIDNRVFTQVTYPDFLLTLRSDQLKCANNYIADNQNPYLLRGSIQMPTGKGKSILGLYLAHYYKAKTLIVVHKDDLVRGWKEDVALSFGNNISVGIIKAKSRVVGEQITIATIQTLSKLPKEELEVLFNTFGMVIQDEMHHCPASSFELVNKFNCRYRLGLTATPEREDGLSDVMNYYFGDFSTVIESSNEDEYGDILPVKVKRIDIPFSYIPYCYLDSKSGKYKLCKNDNIKESIPINQLPFENRPNISHLTLDKKVVSSNLSIYSNYIINTYNKGFSVIAFLAQKEQVRNLKEFLVKKGVPENDIGLYYGDTSQKENENILKTAETKRKYITLTTYSKATEGTNVKQWEVAFLISSIKSGKNLEQAIGRIRRSKKDNKLKEVIVYDFRYPNVYLLKNHTYSKDLRYKKLKIIN